MLPDFENLELRAAVIDLRLHLATVKLERALHAYGDYLEGKYSPDQPRAPKGTPEGGRWIDDAGSARQLGLGDERIRVAQYSTGNLVAEYKLVDGIQCIYRFDFGLVAVRGSVFGCATFALSASVVHGYRLNDNQGR